MGSDRARISFDPTRHYRSVVTQQGRVTLEADINEQAAIAGEALRLETLDIVGPAGTPDGGYRVAVDQNGRLVVGAGTMYVGGWRMRLNEDVSLSNQPDWLDQPVAGTVSPPVVGTVSPPSEQSLVALLVIEQSVSATEDQALREVALGGPDTAARTRLMQHFVEIPITQDTCAAAAAAAAQTLQGMGLIWHPKTLDLTFDAQLQVSFFPPAPPSDPCSPQAQGGYLGADNQLVQVTVTDYDPATQTGTLLWGWNNASFLYRASLVDATANPQILQLSQTPIDAEHTPQPDTVVEVLRTTAVLGNPNDANYIAAAQGQVIALGSGTIYDPNQNQLTLPTGDLLPGPYQTDTNPLFVRLWQAQVPFTNGQVTPLDAVSGLAVTVQMNALPTGQFLARPFWQLAVRPNMPQQVYPQRYLEGLQPPDGPRQWLCDLAIAATGAASDTPYSTVATGVGNGGNLQVICIGQDDSQPYLIWQDESTGDWTAFGALPNSDSTSYSAVATGAGNGGNLQVILIGANDGQPYLIWQDDGTGDWTAFGALPNTGNTPYSLVATGLDNGGNLQVILIGTNDGQPYLISQDAANGNWTNAGALPNANGTAYSAVAAGVGYGGDLQVVCIGANDGQPYVTTLNQQGIWNDFSALPNPNGTPYSLVAAGVGNQGNLQVVCLGQNDGQPYLIWQDDSNGNWNYFGMLPNSNSTAFSAVTTGVGNGGNLQVILIGANDGQPYLIWQNDRRGRWNDFSALPNTGNVEDCRIFLAPRTQQEETCCGLTLDPAGVAAMGGLQAVVDALAARRQSLSLRPGRYVLAAPLALTGAHTGLLLSGCGGGPVRLAADPRALSNFQTGLITVTGAARVTLQGLTLMLPNYPWITSPPAITAPSAQFALWSQFGINAQGANALTIADCDFVFSSPAATAAASLSLTFGSGLFAQGDCSGLRVARNRFVSAAGGAETATTLNLLLGLWMMSPAGSASTNPYTAGALLDFEAVAKRLSQAAALALLEAGVLDTLLPGSPATATLLDDAEITDNLFDGMTIASLIIAQLGLIRCTDNRVKNSCGGFWFLVSDLGANVEVGRTALNAEQQGAADASVATILRQAMQPTVLASAMQYARQIHAAAVSQAAGRAAVPISEDARKVLIADFTTRGSGAYAKLVEQSAAAQQADVQAGKAPEAQPAADAAKLDEATYKVTSTAYDTLEGVGLTTELLGTKLEAVLSLRNNDIVLTPFRTTDNTQASNSAALPGILTVLVQGGSAGALFITGNRVQAPNGLSIAAASLWGADTLVTGNLFTQLGVREATNTPCAIFITDETNQSVLMANVIHPSWRNLPARTVSVATTTWAFLNTVR